jgi:hypothetical protein
VIIIVIIERVGAGTPARWASNHENALAFLECRGYDSRGAALNARRRRWLEWQWHDEWLPDFQGERDWSLSHRRLGARAAAGDASIVHETAVLCVWLLTNACGKTGHSQIQLVGKSAQSERRRRPREKKRPGLVARESSFRSPVPPLVSSRPPVSSSQAC